MDHLKNFNTRSTLQNEQAHPLQVPNNAGGYTFEVTPQQRLRRFLVLGADSGTYYTSPAELTKDNARVVLGMARTDHSLLRAEIYEVSTRGLAPKQNPTIFALAVACSEGSETDRRSALSMLPQVCRTGTHLFLFATYVQQFRGWGRSLRRAVADWYTSKHPDRLAYQAVKYRQREGWTHHDLLRLSHPVAGSPEIRSLFDWIAHGATDEHTPRLVEGYLKAQEPGREDWEDLVFEYNLPWEALPDRALTLRSTWEALVFKGMPQTALVRQLPRLTRLGVLKPFSKTLEHVVTQITDPGQIEKSRIHPAQLLLASRTYTTGYSVRGNSTWSPINKVTEALNDAFYKAFENVEPTGKRTLQALDVSGSMGSHILGTPLSARDASAALALVTASVEPNHQTVGFAAGSGRDLRSRHRSPNLTPLEIHKGQSLNDAIRTVSSLPFGATDCALPILEAYKNGWEIDTFVVYTDNETWAGSMHPHQALQKYRAHTGIDAKLVVVAMTSTGFTIADPQDPGMLDVVGFDSSTPQLIGQFSQGL